jgi:hypothetical protein
MGAAGTGSQVIKDSILYGPTSEDVPVPKFEDIPAEFGANLFKTFGWSEYVLNSLKDGKPYKAALDAFAPPFEIFDRIVSAGADYAEDGEIDKTGSKAALDYIPIAGKIYRYWFEGGAKEAAEKTRKKKEKEMLDIGGDVDELLGKYSRYQEM